MNISPLHHAIKCQDASSTGFGTVGLDVQGTDGWTGFDKTPDVSVCFKNGGTRFVMAMVLDQCNSPR